MTTGRAKGDELRGNQPREARVGRCLAFKFEPDLLRREHAFVDGEEQRFLPEPAKIEDDGGVGDDNHRP